jgi:hypothetical protein
MKGSLFDNDLNFYKLSSKYFESTVQIANTMRNDTSKGEQLAVTYFDEVMTKKCDELGVFVIAVYPAGNNPIQSKSKTAQPLVHFFVAKNVMES